MKIILTYQHLFTLVIMQMIMYLSVEERTLIRTIYPLNQRTYPNYIYFDTATIYKNDGITVHLNYNQTEGNIGQLTYRLYFRPPADLLHYFTASSFPYSYHFIQNQSNFVTTTLRVDIPLPTQPNPNVTVNLQIFINNIIKVNSNITFLTSQTYDILKGFQTVYDNQIVYLRAAGTLCLQPYITFGLKYQNGTELVNSNNQTTAYFCQYLQVSYNISNGKQFIYPFIKKTDINTLFYPMTLFIQAEKYNGSFSNFSNSTQTNSSNSTTTQNSTTQNSTTQNSTTQNQKRSQCKTNFYPIYLKDNSILCLEFEKLIFDIDLNVWKRNCSGIENSQQILQKNSYSDCICKANFKWINFNQECIFDDQAYNQTIKLIAISILSTQGVITVLAIFLAIICRCCGYKLSKRGLKRNKQKEQSLNDIYNASSNDNIFLNNVQ